MRISLLRRVFILYLVAATAFSGLGWPGAASEKASAAGMATVQAQLPSSIQYEPYGGATAICAYSVDHVTVTSDYCSTIPVTVKWAMFMPIYHPLQDGFELMYSRNGVVEKKFYRISNWSDIPADVRWITVSNFDGAVFTEQVAPIYNQRYTYSLDGTTILEGETVPADALWATLSYYEVDTEDVKRTFKYMPAAYTLAYEPITVSAASSGSSGDYMKPGDTYTATLQSVHPIKSLNVSIAGASETPIKLDSDGKLWQAAKVLGPTDTEGPVSLAIQYEDMSGNIGTVTSPDNGQVYIFDRTPPVTVISTAQTDMTAGPVTYTANTTETLSGIEVKKWANGTQNAAYFATEGNLVSGNSFQVSENGAYTWYARDVAGNEEIRPFIVSLIDDIAPELTLTAVPDTGFTNSSVNILVSRSDAGSGVAAVKWAAGSHDASYFSSGGGSSLLNDSITVTENGTYTFYAMDHAGNETVKQIAVGQIDKEAPVITLQPDTTAPTNQDVTIAYSAIDASSGIASSKWAEGARDVAYFKDNGTLLSSSSVRIVQNGTYTFYAEDRVGNKAVQSIIIDNIDKTAPTISLRMDSTAWTNGPATINVTAEDSDSGIAVVKWARGKFDASYFTSDGVVLTGDSFDVMQNGLYTVYVQDLAGNERLAEIEVTTIDHEAPVIAYSVSETDWTSRGVKITVTATDNSGAAVRLKWSEGTHDIAYFATGGTAMTDEFTAANNGVYTIYGEDAAGNGIVVAVTIGNIDKTQPLLELTIASTAWTRGPVSIAIQAEDPDSGMAEVKWAAGDKDAAFFTSGEGAAVDGNAISVKENGTYSFFAKDRVGNAAVKTIKVDHIDLSPPSMQLQPSPTTPTNSAVAVAFSAHDEGSGVAFSKWAPGIRDSDYFKNEGNMILSSMVSLPANGIYTFYAEDILGNGSTQTIEIQNIDLIAPALKLTLDPSTWTNGKVTVQVSATDSESGISLVKWASGKYDASYFTSSGTELSGGSFEVAQNGLYTVYAKDHAGNESVAEIEVSNIDHDAPVITHTVSETDWTSRDVTINVSVTDQSGAEVRLKWSEGARDAAYFATAGMDLTDEFRATKNSVYTIYAEDAAGNAAIATVTIGNIDKTKPLLGLSVASTNWTRNPVEIEVQAEDNDSGIAELKWAAGVQEASFFTSGGGNRVADSSVEVTENGTYTFFARDQVGNTAIKSITIDHIDLLPPVIQLKASPTTPTNGKVTVAYDVVDAGSGVAFSKWASGVREPEYFKSEGTAILSSTVSMPANGIYTFYAEDKLGNGTIETIEIQNIDLVAPAISVTIDSQEWTRGKVKVNVSATDTESGIALVKWAQGKFDASYFTNSGTALSVASFEAVQNGIYTVYAKDHAGNESVAEVEVTTIDLEAPVITHTVSTTAWTNQDVVISVSASDDSHSAIRLKWSAGDRDLAYFAKDGTDIANGSFAASRNGIYTIYAEDAAGNAVVERIEIANIDKDKPVISLIGKAEIEVWRGYAYTEPGATATDEQEGDLTSRIVIAGDKVDTKQLGTYTIRYQVTDRAGNMADEVIRKVVVLPAPFTPPPATTEPENKPEPDPEPEPQPEPVQPGQPNNGAPFYDIAGHWAEPSIRLLYDKRLVTGYPNNSFRPDNPVTRAEFVALLARVLKLNDPHSLSYADTAGHWAGNAIAAATANGIVSGYSDNRFGPDDPITREQMAVMLAKAMKLSGPTQPNVTVYADQVSISSWAQEAILRVTEAGLMTGYPNHVFKPKGAATRAEVCVVIAKLIAGESSQP